MPLKQGRNWHVDRVFQESSKSAWIEYLRSMSVLSNLINRFWPRETLALEFYQTSTMQQLNRMTIHPNSRYCISADGQWIAGLLHYQNQLCLYSTTQITRWPVSFAG
jgi:hypothetical protein